MDCKIVKTKLVESDSLPKDTSDLSEDLRNHVWECPSCRNFYNGLVQTQQALQKISNVEPPKSILNNYLSDLYRKIRLIENSGVTEVQESPLRRWDLLRPAFSLAAILLVVISAWWFGTKSDINVESENLATDSLEYYIDAYSEEAAQNSVASVKGFEYEWAYNTNIRK
jgi:hypothetical protein